MYEKFVDYLKLMRLNRPIGIFLLLWPTMWALWFAAGGMPDPHVLFVFVAGTVLMRSAGCAINDYADRGIDPHVARTKDRPIASGRIKPEEAVRLFVAISLIAFGLLTSLKNVHVILLSIPGAALAASYPFMKRWIALPQAYLGLAFSWGIPMAFATIQRDVDWNAGVELLVANLFWVMAYDTYYAMVDRADDLKIGVKSSAILFGRHDRLAIALMQGASLLLLIQLGLNHQRGNWYYAGIAMAAWLAVYQQWITRNREPAACFRAFLNNNWFGAAIFAGLVIDLL